MVRTLILFIGLVFSSQSLALTQVTASVDKNPVVIKESLVLTVIADDDVDANALDTSPLLNDFIVGRTSVSSHTSMVNFTTSRTTKWTTLLVPRREGQLTIPALTVENKQTAPIALVVLGKNDQTTRQQDIFLTAEVSAEEVYVQQILTLTVKLHFAAELKRANLNEPSLEGALIQQMGDQVESETLVNGRRFRVIEISYAVTPQQSGQFILKSPVFSGEILMQSNRRSSFFSFGDSKPVSVVADDIPINVKPVPAQYQGQWLPSELLALHEEWQPSPAEFKVGEPITRTITLTAAGVSAEQLPELMFNLPDGLKIYPDQAELHSSKNNGRLISQAVRNFAIVASQPGQYEIPKLQIPWWNTVTNKQEVAVLEAQTISIAENDATQGSQFNTPSMNNAQTDTVAPQTIIVEKTPLLQWLFLALWLLTSLGWLTQFMLSKRNKKPTENKAQSVNEVHLTLLAACKKHQGEQVIALLLPWAKSIVPNAGIHSISAAKTEFASTDFNDAVDQLYNHYYGNTSSSASSWQGNLLFSAVNKVHAEQKKSQQSAPHHLALNP